MPLNATGSGSIIDRGYQHYEGRRLGVAYADWVIIRAALQRGMGIKRRWSAKIIPWLLVAAAYLPIIFFLIGSVVLHLGGNNPFRPSASAYSDIYGLLTVLVVLFAAILGPELLCPERRERVLSLYFVAPITRIDYVLAKLAAVLALLLLITLLPALIFFFGSAFLETDAFGYMSGHLIDVWHILLGGLLVSAYYGSLSIAVASFNDRRAYAVGTYIGLILIESGAANILGHLDFSGHTWFYAADMLNAPVNAVSWMFGVVPQHHVDGWAYLGVSLLTIAVSCAIVFWRYLRMSDG